MYRHLLGLFFRRPDHFLIYLLILVGLLLAYRALVDPEPIPAPVEEGAYSPSLY